MSLRHKEFKESDLAVYVVTHGPECAWLDDYCIPIEVGAALRDNLRYETRDDTGDDHISEKNRLYNEITALYWMWKNDNHEYVGLYHYRRVFKLSKAKIITLLKEYDYILPQKSYNKRHFDKQFIIDHYGEENYYLILSAINDLYPEYGHYSQKYFESSTTTYWVNMFISSKKMADRYCEWLFPLIQKIEREGIFKSDSRFIGCFAEHLFSLYIHYNIDNNHFKVKDVPIYFTQPIGYLTTKCPKSIAKILMSNIYLYNMILEAQNNIYHLLQKIRA